LPGASGSRIAAFPVMESGHRRRALPRAVGMTPRRASPDTRRVSHRCRPPLRRVRRKVCGRACRSETTQSHIRVPSPARRWGELPQLRSSGPSGKRRPTARRCDEKRAPETCGASSPPSPFTPAPCRRPLRDGGWVRPCGASPNDEREVTGRMGNPARSVGGLAGRREKTACRRMGGAHRPTEGDRRLDCRRLRRQFRCAFGRRSGGGRPDPRHDQGHRHVQAADRRDRIGRPRDDRAVVHRYRLQRREPLRPPHLFPWRRTDPYKAPKTTLEAEIDEEARESLGSAVSRPFPKPESGRIVVKIVNRLGDENEGVRGEARGYEKNRLATGSASCFGPRAPDPGVRRGKGRRHSRRGPSVLDCGLRSACGRDARGPASADRIAAARFRRRPLGLARPRSPPIRAAGLRPSPLRTGSRRCRYS
jgi:hypothetical protein